MIINLTLREATREQKEYGIRDITPKERETLYTAVTCWATPDVGQYMRELANKYGADMVFASGRVIPIASIRDGWNTIVISVTIDLQHEELLNKADPGLGY